MELGLRIDVDTYRGTRDGVPRLLALLGRHGIRATFFFSVGPDNMGRHLWRLIRPAFLLKMLRSNAPGLYGWDILLRGTLWPGSKIGARLGDIIRAADKAGHEIGLHAWDHHAWQMRMETMDDLAIRRELRRGWDALTEILGREPTCSAAPGWKCNELVLREKSALAFGYNSDCRGARVFRPVFADGAAGQPQVPVTLPTYDEIIGSDGITDEVYNDYMLSQLERDKLNVLTIHAEVEGIARADLFEGFLELLARNHIACRPLGEMVASAGALPDGTIEPGAISGREGWVAVQKGLPTT